MGRPRKTHKEKKENGTLHTTRMGKEPTPALLTEKGDEVPSDILGDAGKDFFSKMYDMVMKAEMLGKTDVLALTVFAQCWDDYIASIRRQKNEKDKVKAWRWRAETNKLRLELWKWSREFGLTPVTRDIVNQVENKIIDTDNLFND